MRRRSHVVVRFLGRLLLLAYPKNFRQRFGNDLLRTLDDRLDEPETRRDRLAFLGKTVLSLLRCALSERLDATSRRRRPRPSERLRVLERLRQDAGWAWRSLGRQPGFLALALMTLAIGIGANTAIFSLVRGVLQRPLPYEEPDRLVTVWPGQLFSKELLVRFRQEARAVERLEASAAWTVTLMGAGEPEEVEGLLATPGLTGLLGLRMQLGRGLESSDGESGAEPVVVLSNGLWRRHFGGDQGVIGSLVDLSLAGGPESGLYRVVGVLPADVGPLLRDLDLLLPMSLDPAADDYSGSWYLTTVLGRLAEGVGQDGANSDIERVAHRLAEDELRHLEPAVLSSAHLVPTAEWLVRDVRWPLVVLLGSVALLLLLACANVANLLLVRLTTRQREWALRAALGAGQGRLVRQQLFEGIFLALLGGVVGNAVAMGLVHLLRAPLAARLPRAEEITVDPWVLLFALAISLATGVLCALAPALRIGFGTASTEALRRVRGTLLSRRESRLQLSFVVVEVALATLLVAAAGLLARSFVRLVDVDPGFDASGVTVLSVAPPVAHYREGTRWADYFDRAVERLESVPGVDSVGGIHLLPLTAANWSFPYDTADQPIEPGAPPREANYRVIVGDYFHTLHIPLLEGRTFAPSDRASAQRVVILNQRLATALWPQGGAIGKELRLFLNVPYRVIGVVGDVHQHGLDTEARPEMYFHLPQQQPTGRVFLMARSSHEGDRLGPALREAIGATASDVASDVPIGAVTTLDSVVGESVARSRLLASTSSVFGILALLLGALGIYSVVSYATAARVSEMGLRMALGAGRAEILAVATRRVLLGSLAGLLAGLASALLFAGSLESVLFETAGRDVAVFSAVTLSVAGAIAMASFIPASRLGRLDPARALRDD